MEHTLDSLGYVHKLDEFYNVGSTSSTKPSFYLALDPLNSWGAHAVPHLDELNPLFAKYKAYSLGNWNRSSTESDRPGFSGSSFLSDLVWHEGRHIYLADVLKAQEETIASISHQYNGKERSIKR